MSDITRDTASEPVAEQSNLFHQLARRIQSQWRSIIVFVPYAWLLVFFLLPFFIVAKISLAEIVIASPPFSDMIEWTEDGAMNIRLVFDNFVYILTDNLYYKTYFNSLKISIVSTIVCLLIGYPMAYGIVARVLLQRDFCCSPSYCRSGRRSCCACTRGWVCWPTRAPSTIC